MDKYRVELSATAFKDLDDIFRYIALEKQSPLNAKKQTDRIQIALKKLETMPQAYQEREICKPWIQTIID